MSSPEGTRAQRWLARLSFLLAGVAIVILVVFAGLKSVAMLAVGLAAAAVSLAALRSGSVCLCAGEPVYRDVRE